MAFADRSWALGRDPEDVSGASEPFDVYSLTVLLFALFSLAPHTTIRVVPVAISDLEAVPA